MARQEGALEKRGLLLKQVLAVVIIVLLDLDRAMQLVRQKKEMTMKCGQRTLTMETDSRKPYSDTRPSQDMRRSAVGILVEASSCKKMICMMCITSSMRTVRQAASLSSSASVVLNQPPSP